MVLSVLSQSTVRELSTSLATEKVKAPSVPARVFQLPWEKVSSSKSFQPLNDLNGSLLTSTLYQPPESTNRMLRKKIMPVTFIFLLCQSA